MTDQTPVAPHLDDEALVALLDGEVAASELQAGGVHLSGCPTCRARHEALSGASALVATPVDPLAEDLKDAMVFRAIVAATDDSSATPATDDGAARPEAPIVPLASHRKIWREPLMRAAAAIVVVAGVGAGAWAATRPSTPAAHIAALAVPSGGSSSAHTAIVAPAPLLEFRPLTAGTTPSCGSVAAPDPGRAISLPDAIDSPADHQTCLAVGPALSTVTSAAPTTIAGPAGLAAPDTLTVSLPATIPALRPHLTSGSGTGGVSVRGGSRLVAVGDGAVIGVVTSVTSLAGGGEVVVIGEVDPAVAEYLEGVLNG